MITDDFIVWSFFSTLHWCNDVDIISCFLCSAGSTVTSLDMLLRLFSYLMELMEVIC